MECSGGKPRGRPRKRRRGDGQNGENVDGEGNVQDMVENSNGDCNGGNEGEDGKNAGNFRKRGRPPKRRAVEVKGDAVVGRYVLKDFEGNGVFLGKIVSYDSGLYRVDYEDGDFEDLDSGELREFLIGDERQKFVGELLERKKKLDENVAQKIDVKSNTDENVAQKIGGKSKTDRKIARKIGRKKEDIREVVDESGKASVAEPIDIIDKPDSVNMINDTEKVEVPTSSGRLDEEVGGSEVDDDDVSDSSSDSCEYGQGWDTRAESEIPDIPPPELPPSSGSVGVPEEYVSHLFSVYGFLRSFSIRLFLSPFTLDDLVGCLRCTVPNTLLDAIHVGLLKALKRHLEAQASDGLELASKCLRCIDWGLLDILTWPVYLVHYLMGMGHMDQKEWKGFYIDALQKDYCTLSIGTKLMVLQILCDDALVAEEIRADIDEREESEVGIDFDGISSNPLENGPRKVYPRSAKTSISKNRENVDPEAETSIWFGSNSTTVKGKDQDTKPDNINEDVNGDECRLCVEKLEKMKSYCSRNNNLVAMGWFLVILGLVITSGVDGGSINIGRLVAGFKNWKNGIVRVAKQKPSFKEFLMNNKDLLLRLTDARNVKDLCSAVKSIEKEYSEERSFSIPNYQTFQRLAKFCNKLNSLPSVRN